MAVSLGQNLAERGADVTLFLDREAVRMADARQRGDLTWGDTGGIAAALDGFVAAGGRLVLCPHCAALGGVDPAQLRAGATVATHEQVADIFLAADKVIDF
jgi:sulfur relay (sulfurtransferase) complex TusBCD TusD component (DsrE family)